MFSTLILFALSPFLGTVSDDTTPVGSAMIDIVIADPATSGPMCDAYREVMSTVAALGGDPIWVEVTDAYAIVMLEGDNLRLDNGARDTLTDWLHTSCS